MKTAFMSGVQTQISRDASAPARRPTLPKYCLKCSYVGKSKEYRPGTLRMEIGLWLLFLSPLVVDYLWKEWQSNAAFQYSLQRMAAQFPAIFAAIETLINRYKAGAFGPAMGLWLVCLVPGILYSFWRLSARHEGCGKCGSYRIVNLESPYAQAHLAKLTPTPSMRSWVCMSCASQIFTGGRVCPTCGAEQPELDI